ncbi:polyribonucleotide nucleotidyltransferase [Patescibacteria group bacterium]|nr:polyribonucleotide nucleotidyltransferase [Patescibacteria group bacterium]
MNHQVKEIAYGHDTIKLEFNRLAPQTNASVVATMGKTVVLATVIAGKLDETRDYFPLSVEFMDKLYAGGLIKGGKWVKREGGQSDASVLFSRIIDRSIRPLFPHGFQQEVQVIATLLSNDKDSDAVTTAFAAAAAALTISDIPFNGPVSAVRVAKVDGQLKANPTLSELKASDLDLLVCTGPAGVNMIEAGANIVDNDTMLSAITLAKETGDQINSEIAQIAKELGKEKFAYEPFAPSAELIKEVKGIIEKDIDEFLGHGQDLNAGKAEEKIFKKVEEAFADRIKAEEVNPNLVKAAFEELVKNDFRARVLKGYRFDGRKHDEIRPLHIEAGVLPCTHGSALFQRGLTQAVTVTTLSSLAEQQYLQDSYGEVTKRYIHYYSAMPFSTGETGKVGRPGRREIGHGALAEKALVPVIPSEAEFPYTIVVTSEIMSQNGSSSMASTCGSTLSLMDAGVPIKDKVAGISVGMVSDGDEKYALLTDIAGIEDHNGDMDFKITGTHTGITAIQLDIKRQGLTLQMIADTFVASTKARLFILDQMEKVITAPRTTLSTYAPKIKLVRLPEEKIGEVIGSGGKTIKALMQKYGVQIDIDDLGNASISAVEQDKIDAAAYEIESMIKEVQVGEEYDGIVTRVEPFGAFIEFLPGREALLHVSEMTGGFLKDPTTIIKIGDKLKVKISGFNDNHQIKLAAPEFKAAHPGEPRTETNRTEFRPGGFRNFQSGPRRFGR